MTRRSFLRAFLLFSVVSAGWPVHAANLKVFYRSLNLPDAQIVTASLSAQQALSMNVDAPPVLTFPQHSTAECRFVLWTFDGNYSFETDVLLAVGPSQSMDGVAWYTCEEPTGDRSLIVGAINLKTGAMIDWNEPILEATHHPSFLSMCTTTPCELLALPTWAELLDVLANPDRPDKKRAFLRTITAHQNILVPGAGGPLEFVEWIWNGAPIGVNKREVQVLSRVGPSSFNQLAIALYRPPNFVGWYRKDLCDRPDLTAKEMCVHCIPECTMDSVCAHSPVELIGSGARVFYPFCAVAQLDDCAPCAALRSGRSVELEFEHSEHYDIVMLNAQTGQVVSVAEPSSGVRRRVLIEARHIREVRGVENIALLIIPKSGPRAIKPVLMRVKERP